MPTTRSIYAWLAICLISIFICLKTEATPLATIAKPASLATSQLADAFRNFNIDEAEEVVSIPKNIVARSADSDDNSVDGDDDDSKDDTTEKPKPSSEEIFPRDKVHPIEPEMDSDMNNPSSGFMEFLRTLLGLLWGVLSNIPALLGSSSSGASGGQ